MAGGVGAEVRDFALDPQSPEAFLDEKPGFGVHLADRANPVGASRKGLAKGLHRRSVAVRYHRRGDGPQSGLHTSDPRV